MEVVADGALEREGEGLGWDGPQVQYGEPEREFED